MHEELAEELRLAGVPYLDASVYRARDGRSMSVFLVNRDVKREAKGNVQLGAADWSTPSIRTPAAGSYKAMNSPEAPATLVPYKRGGPPAEMAGERLTVFLPRHSLTVIDLRRARGN